MRTNSFVSCCGRCNLFALHDARGESRLLLAGYRRTRCLVRCVWEPEPSKGSSTQIADDLGLRHN